MTTLLPPINAPIQPIAFERVDIQWLINSARTLIFSTTLPACVVAASIEAVKIIMKDKKLLKKLWHNRNNFYNGITYMELNTGHSETPIIPIILKSNEDVLRLSAFLMENSIYVPPIRKPAVSQPRLRITITASHTEEDINKLIQVLKKAKDKKLC